MLRLATGSARARAGMGAARQQAMDMNRRDALQDEAIQRDVEQEMFRQWMGREQLRAQQSDEAYRRQVDALNRTRQDELDTARLIESGFTDATGEATDTVQAAGRAALNAISGAPGRAFATPRTGRFSQNVGGVPIDAVDAGPSQYVRRGGRVYKLDRQRAANQEAEALANKERMAQAADARDQSRALAIQQAIADRIGGGRGGSGGGAGGAGGAPVGAAGPAPADASTERQLRTEFERDLAPHREIARGYQTVKSAADMNTPQGDLALMYGLIRMFDPGSVVREGEMATLQKSASIDQSLRAELQRYIGEGRVLPPEVRRRYVDVATRLATDQRNALRQVMAETSIRNMRYGIPSEAIVSDPYSAVMGSDLGAPRAGAPRDGRRPPLSAYPGGSR